MLCKVEERRVLLRAVKGKRIFPKTKEFSLSWDVAVGIIPIWHIIKNLQLRGDFYCFTPFFKIEQSPINNEKAVYGKFMRNPEFLGEITIAYNFPFASISMFTNYYSYPSRNWNFGLNIGILMYNPKFKE